MPYQDQDWTRSFHSLPLSGCVHVSRSLFLFLAKRHCHRALRIQSIALCWTPLLVMSLKPEQSLVVFGLLDGFDFSTSALTLQLERSQWGIMSHKDNLVLGLGLGLVDIAHSCLCKHSPLLTETTNAGHLSFDGRDYYLVCVKQMAM